MKHGHSILCRRNLRAYAAAFISYLMLAGQLAPLALAGAPRPPAPPAAATASAPLSAAPQPAPLPFFAPGITATKTDAFADPNGNGKAEPGDTITYTVTITNSGPDEATGVTFTDNVDGNTTLIPTSITTTPIARPDSYSVLGNVRIQVPDGASDLLANDCDPSEDGSPCTNAGLTITASDSTSARGGNVTVNTTTGAFTYNPPAGYEGADSFTYTVTDAEGKTDTGTVTLTVSGMIWFIDDTAAPCVSIAAGCGRLTNPLTTLAAFEAANGGSTTNGGDVVDPEAGDNIFLFAGAYVGPLTLESAQKLIGEGASATLQAISGVTVPAHSDPLPATTGNQSSVTLTSAGDTVTLGPNNAAGSDNLLRGFTIGNSTDTDITGANFGDLAISEVTLNGTGRALDLNNGGFVSGSSVTSVTVTASTSQGILLQSIGGANGLTIGGTTIAGTTAQGIHVSGSAAPFSFGNTAVGNAAAGSGGTVGVSLQNSAGSRTFGTLSIQNSSQQGLLHAVGGGPLTVTGATTITNPGAAGMDIQDSTTAISFQNATVNASGGTGVFVDDSTGAVSFAALNINPDGGQRALHVTDQTTGAFTVTSGTITTTTGTAVEIATASGTTPLSVVFNNVSVNGAPSGVVLQNTTGSFQLTGDGSTTGGVLDRDGSGGTLTNTTSDAVRLTNAANVTIRQVNINSPGDTVTALIADNEDTPGEHGVEITGGSSNIILSAILVDSPSGSGIIARNITGTNRLNQGSLVTNIDNPSTHGLFIRNASGFNLTLFEVNDTDFTNSSSGASTLNVMNDGTANMTVEVENGCIFEALESQAVTMDAGRTAGTTGTLTSTVTNCTFRNAVVSQPSPGIFVTSENNLAVLANFGALHNATVSNNLFDNIAEDGRVANTSIIRTQNSGGRLNATVSGNTIQNINYQTGAGGRHVIGHVFEPAAFAAGNFSNLRIEGNNATNITYTATNREFIFVNYRDQANGGSVRILNNTWNMPTNAATSESIELTFEQVNAGQTVNVEVDGNNGTFSGNTRFMNVDVEAAATANFTITDNTFTNTGGAPGPTLDLATEDNAAAGDAVACFNISNNTLSPNTITLNEGANTTMTVTQASQAALAAANGGAAVTVLGTPAFSAPPCAMPTNGPETTDISSGQNDGPVGVGSGSAEESPEAAPADGVEAHPADRPVASALAPNVAGAEAKRSAGTFFRHTAEDSSAPLNPGLAPETAAQRQKLAAPVLGEPGQANAPGAGGTVSVNIGTLPAGDSVTITFQVTVEDPYDGGPNVSNQGTVSGTNFSPVLTDEVAGGAADPTITPINATDIRINDATASEPSTGDTPMLFTVTLSQPAPAGGITVTYNTADGTATGGAACGGSVDYVSVTNGAVTVTAGSQVGTAAVTVCADGDSPEPSETLTVTISSPTAGTLVDNVATGTITQGTTAGTFVISELRTSGPAGTEDDFVEFYNNSDAALTVAATDASAGYGLFKMGGTCADTPVLIATIPAGTVIPARGHFLAVGTGYSLANYGGTGAAAGDVTFTTPLGDDNNVAVFSTADIANISSANRLDAVGFGGNAGAVCDLLREANNLGAVAGSTTEHTFFRKQCDFVGGTGCTVAGNPKDTNDNLADFMFADTMGTPISGVTQKLGAPGPENRTSPVRRDTSGIGLLFLDGTKSASAPPNRSRDLTPGSPSHSTFGTLTIRRRVVNNTGAPVTRLRFRIIELTTFPSPGGGQSDMRARTGVVETSASPGVGLVNDPATCAATGSPAAPPCNVTVQPTTLEEPPLQPNGGGYNSTLSAGTITTGTPLPNGASLNVNFLLGVQVTGSFRFLLIIEALP